MQRVKKAGLGASIVLLAAAATGCGGEASGSAAKPTGTAAAGLSPRSVRIGEATAAPAAAGYPSALYIERDVKVTARRSGLVERVLADRGAHVRSGQVLAELERDLAENDLQVARQLLRRAEADYERLHRLGSESVVSPQDLERSEIDRDVARSKADLARAWVERSVVRAPFDGVVAERWAVAGQHVEEEDGTPLFRVIADDPLRARIDIPEDKGPSLVRGGAARVVEVTTGRESAGRIVFVAPAIDSASGTLAAVVELARGAGMRPGAAVTVLPAGIAGAPLPVARLLVPTEALVGEDSVFVVVDGRVSSRTLRIVERRGSSVVVEGPIAAGDTVVLAAPDGLADGDAVAILRAAW